MNSGRRRKISRADNFLVRAVARLPAPIRRKLTVAFAAIVVLLVVIGGLGWQLLAQSNGRVSALGELQQRVAVYKGLQIDNNQLRSLRAQRSADIPLYAGTAGQRPPAPSAPAATNNDPYAGYLGQTTSKGAGVTDYDDTIESTVTGLRSAYDPTSFGFTPPKDEAPVVAGIQSDYEQFADLMIRVANLHRAGKTLESQQLLSSQAEPVAYRLESATDDLVEKTENETAALIDQNRQAYLNARRTFAGFALAGVGLALLLGFTLSWSLIGPIQRMNARLAELAAGDFSRQVQVVNHDELGELATNLNHMNDELGRLYHDLETASRHKSEFLANMSHELRTPLNAIIGFSEVLTEQMFGPVNERQAAYLTDILTSGRHLLSLINDILDLSKVEAGKMELELSVFSLPEMLANSLTVVRERATRHGIDLGLHVGAGVGDIQADERKVKQVVFNLLSNAVKATAEGGRVDLFARRAGDDVAVAVADTGVGIDAEDQARIFEEFQQVGQREGTGLGLPLARRFVALHGGRLDVESEPGVGSTFTFTLPVRQSGGAPLILEPDSGCPTVLLVEDDQNSVELLTLYLEGAGFRVVACRDGELGIDAARSLRPAAIVLDIMLPGLSGWDFLTLVKEDAATARIPVVIVSILDERGQGFALGAADYLVKPVARDDLLATLRSVSTAQFGDGCKVLAIDDGPLAVGLIETVLEAEGFAVVTATSGEAGIRAAQDDQPDVIILDLLMPEIDGFEVVERLRADPSTAQIPIVILTAKSIEAADRERLAAHVAHLAGKESFSRDQFVDMVRRFCEHQVA